MPKRRRDPEPRSSRKGSKVRAGAKRAAGAAAVRPRSSSRRVYSFGAGTAEGRAQMRERLGGKGANLAEMSRLGVPVPAGFTISTEVCREFFRNRRRLPRDLRERVLKALAKVEREMGCGFGDSERPLLVSVRSGARVSMPGMMDTVLNLGLNDRTVEGLAERSRDPRFAFDSYRRFIQMYGNVVLGIDHACFEQHLGARKKTRGVELDTALEVGDLTALVAVYKREVERQAGRAFPERPIDQLFGAISAVFESWELPRARTYRKLNGIPDDWGTAVTVQAMVFGNLGAESATGVAFTRNPSTGERRFFGEYLPEAQGEDVVAGIRTPHPISRADRRAGDPESLEEAMPALYRQLVRVARRLEKHYRDSQDLEFTIQEGTLWMLQTRTGKRTGAAAVRMAVDMVRERLIDRPTALRRVEPSQLDQLLHPTLDVTAAPATLGQGLPASPGAASGAIVFSADRAEARARAGHDVILVRRETSPEDIHGMVAARGVLTALGGMTSHAAVVARGMGKCCVTGCSELQVDAERGIATLSGTELKDGDVITLDGSTGRIYAGPVATRAPELDDDFRTLMRWADQARHLEVRTNADTPEDAALARSFGAEGIGLCRTEHMFFQADRILAVRRMILADSPAARALALARILPMQRGDFEGIFEAMKGLPVTIRLLDPPLHEFLPHDGVELERLARDLEEPLDEVQRKVDAQREQNPMLGHRGCRLGISHPEIYEMQARAIFQAACAAAKRGLRPMPEIMIPLVIEPRELEVLRALVEAVAREEMAKAGRRVRFSVGTMIEVPRAALLAEKLARHAEFFSFGTNDLTQTALALSRDDAGRFLPEYVERGLLPGDPFVTLDATGVGELVRMGVERGRRGRPGLKIGVCGEHGGDPASVRLFEQMGLDYVSCSPFRVPIARLAAAHVALERELA